MKRQRPAAGLRSAIRSRRRAFYQHAWPHVLVFWAVMGAIIAVMVGLTASDFLSGLFLGGFGVATVMFTDRIASESDGSWRFALGRDAETWTADDLAWFRRRWWLRRERWHVVHSVGFHRGDVDHVLLGPNGVLALETKYRSIDVRFDEDRALREAAAQVDSGARRVAALIRQHTGEEVDVRPAVVTQGRGWTWPEGAAQQTVDGVPVLRGGQSREWDLGDGRALTRSACRRISRALNDYAMEQLRVSKDGRGGGSQRRGTRA